MSRPGGDAAFRPATAPRSRAAVRPEIQALRATAVLLVVVCHLWPAVLPGGSVGVDVFFAISGFLITSQRQVLAWLGRHPEVGTVFVSGLSGGSGVVPERGRSEFATSLAGYRGAWNALPASVARIVVIRDTPKMRGRRNACVERAVERRRPPEVECALPRRTALDPDPIVAGRARGARTGRAAGRSDPLLLRRAPVLPGGGGILVCKDSTHLTARFAGTLGPYLLRATDRALTGPAEFRPTVQ